MDGGMLGVRVIRLLVLRIDLVSLCMLIYRLGCGRSGLISAVSGRRAEYTLGDSRVCSWHHLVEGHTRKCARDHHSLMHKP